MTNYRLKDLESDSPRMKNLDESTGRKRKRHLEVLSVFCTTIGMNIAIACLCGVPNSFGLSSPDVFLKCAFAFFLASVLLGILAMISCIKGYEFLQTPFIPMPKQSFLFSLLNALHFRRINIEASANPDTEMTKRQLPVAEISEVIEKVQVTPKCLDDSSRQKTGNCGFPQGSFRETYSHSLKSPSGGSALHHTFNKFCKDTDVISDSATSRADNAFLFTASVANGKSQKSPVYNGNSLLLRECGVSTRSQGQRFTSCTSKNIKQLKAKNILQQKKRRNTILFGQLFAADSSGYVRGPITFSCEVDRNKKFGSLPPFGSSENKAGAIEEEFAIQSQPSVTPTSKILTETVFCGVQNSCFQEGYNSQDRFLPFNGKHQVHTKDQVSDVVLKLNEMNFLS